MEPNFKMSVRILPFGSIRYELSGAESVPRQGEVKMPSYTEPITTDIEGIEIRYGDGDNYVVPQTTAGT